VEPDLVIDWINAEPGLGVVAQGRSPSGTPAQGRLLGEAFSTFTCG